VTLFALNLREWSRFVKDHPMTLSDGKGDCGRTRIARSWKEHCLVTANMREDHLAIYSVLHSICVDLWSTMSFERSPLA